MRCGLSRARAQVLARFVLPAPMSSTFLFGRVFQVRTLSIKPYYLEFSAFLSNYMGLLGTSKEEEAALRAAAASNGGVDTARTARSSLSHSVSGLSYYETASDFSSQIIAGEQLQETADDDLQEEEDDATVKDIGGDKIDAQITHSQDVEDDVYGVPEPILEGLDPAIMTENELNRIMTIPTHQGEMLRRSVTKSLAYGEYVDPNDLDWDGPDDKENPYNWSKTKKWFITGVTAYTCLCISLGSSLYVEGVPEIMVQMDVSQTLAISGLSFYLIGLALGPVLAAPLSELFGRRNIYITTFPASLLLTMGVGLSQNIRSILILRFFSGLIASPPMSISGGTISDIWGNSPIDMAIAMAFFCLAPFLGPIIGPIVGGFGAAAHGWRFTMWLSLVFSGFVLPFLFLCPETYKLTILKKRAKKRGIKLVEPEINFAYVVDMVEKNLVRPLEMLFVEPIVGLTSLYVAFVFGVLFGFFEAFPIVFRGVYKMEAGVSGLPFIGIGVGLIFGVLLYVVTNIIANAKAKKAAVEKQKKIAEGEKVEEDVPPWVAPENKLMTAIIGAIFLPVSLFWLAWTSRESIHWIAPVLSGVPFGFGLIWVFFGVVLYYSLSFPPAYLASALAANNLLRYILAAVFPLFVVQMYEKLHIHWATSLLGFIALAMVPIPLLFMKYGAKIRAHSKYGYVAFFKSMAAAKAAAEKSAAEKTAAEKTFEYEFGQVSKQEDSFESDQDVQEVHRQV